MKKYINPISDIFVRYLLGSEENKKLLLDFINTILCDSGFEGAKDITLLNPFNIVSIANSKESILDVKAVDSHNRIFNVEIQVLNDSRYANRTLYYWAKLYSDQLEEGEKYKNLDPVICINLLNFTIFPDLQRPHSCFLPIEKDSLDVILSSE